MISLATIICSFFIIYSSDALQCYECVYYEGHEGSDSSCQNNPQKSITRTCELQYNDTNKRLCIKASGVLHGKPIVARQCMTELSKNNEKCLNVSSLLVYDIGKNITNSTVCYCSNDECNSAASLQFTYLSVLSVLTFAIHSMMYQRTKNFIL